MALVVPPPRDLGERERDAAELWERDAGLRPAHEHTNAQLLQLHGLRHLVASHPDAKWFFVAGDDTYLHPDFTLQMLDAYDPAEPLWLANYPVRDRLGVTAAGRWVLKATTQEKLEEWYPMWRSRHSTGAFEWASGATSWWLSRPAAQRYVDALDGFLQRVAVGKICYCPDVLSGLILSLMGLRVTSIPAFHRKMHAYAVDSKDVDHSDHGEVVLYHYVQPGRMPGIDQCAHHNKLDRMVNAGDPAAVLAYAREFAAVHRGVAARRDAQLRLHCRKLDAEKQLRALPLDGEVGAVEEAARRGDGDGVVAAFRRLIDAHYISLRKWQRQVVGAAQRNSRERRYVGAAAGPLSRQTAHNVAAMDIPSE